MSTDEQVDSYDDIDDFDAHRLDTHCSTMLHSLSLSA